MTEEEKIIQAIKDGKANEVRDLIESDIFLADARDADGTSALLTAIYHGQREIADIILDSAPTLTIHEAAAAGLKSEVEDLLEKNPGLVNEVSHDGWTALHLAAYFNHADVAKILLTAGAGIDVLSTNATAVTPLHSALANRNVTIAKLLLDRGADIARRQESSGYTALHYAAANDLELLAQMMLDRGADPSATDAAGKTPLDLAREKGSERVARLLEEVSGV